VGKRAFLPQGSPGKPSTNETSLRMRRFLIRLVRLPSLWEHRASALEDRCPTNGPSYSPTLLLKQTQGNLNPCSPVQHRFVCGSIDSVSSGVWVYRQCLFRRPST
jgi:hypothetical protein